MQDRIHHGPYRLRAREDRVLPGYPAVQRLKLVGLETDLNWRPFAGRRRAASFPWLHSFFCHETVIP